MSLHQVCAFLILFSAALASVTAVNLTSNSSVILWDGEDSVTLNCTTQIKAETFIWKLNGESLPEDPRYNKTTESSGLSSSLVISPVSRNDTGSFTCTASNATLNETSNALSLSLAWAPDTLNIACNFQSGDNSSIQLSCSWVGAQPAADVTMTFNATEEKAKNNVTREVHPPGDGSPITLLCEGVHLRSNSSCKATVERPQSDHKNETTTSVKQGEDTVLTLNLQSGLYAQFAWFHHNPNPVPLVTGEKYKIESGQSNSTLLISKVTSTDKGTYECVAKTAIGSTSFMFKLDVSQGERCFQCYHGIQIYTTPIMGVLLLKKKHYHSPNCSDGWKTPLVDGGNFVGGLAVILVLAPPVAAFTQKLETRQKFSVSTS